ncbi:hypothetical protein EDB86DRAFT_2929442 [Lactarius hatsudake]|nr:hypothetical protein EDB86DRAFT_2929442 [Lactarius hatsudake]
MGDGQGAYATKSADTDFRRKWDKEEYAERAKKKDDEERERMQENEERMKQGKKPIKGKKKDLPKPTELMKRRDNDLELDKNLGKTMVVQNPGGKGPGQPGFHCETSLGYLDHINGRAHLRALGQTTRLERSTLEQVRAKIAFLRAQTKEASEAKAFDFDKRLTEIRDKELAARAEKKAAKKAEREKARLALAQDTAMQVDGDDMMNMMGFSGFGTTKK